MTHCTLVPYINASYNYYNVKIYYTTSSITNVLCLIVGLYKMYEVVEISDDDECPQFYANQASSSVEECSQSSRSALSSGLNSVPEDLCSADRKKVV